MALSCRVCGAPLEESGFDHARRLARCRYCDALTELELKGGKPRRLPRHLRARPEVPMPAKFEVNRGGGTLTVRWRWMSGKVIVLAIMLMVWGLFLAYAWLGIQVGIMADTPGPGAAAFPVLHGLFGLGLTYATLMGLVNRTTVTAQRTGLQVHHGPLPWFGSGTVKFIDQLYTKRRERHTKSGSVITYQLIAILKGGNQRKIVGGLTQDVQALWLEQELERQLGLEDRPIAGELPRY